MIKISGNVVPTSLISDLKFVRGLIYYDGELLSEDASDKHSYLRYWVDSDSTHNRWLLMRVDPQTIINLIAGKIRLFEVIPGLCLDDFVYIIDVGDSELADKVVKLAISDIPEEYRPHFDSTIDEITK